MPVPSKSGGVLGGGMLTRLPSWLETELSTLSPGTPLDLGDMPTGFGLVYLQLVSIFPASDPGLPHAGSIPCGSFSFCAW